MNSKELIRRALMGDKQAQEECTARGIMLPCPFCGNEYPAISSIQGYGIEIKCQHCNITFSRDFYGYGRAKELNKSVILGAWNTRPAPPTGRCGECEYFRWLIGNSGFCEIESPERISVLENDFCSYFEPREGE